MSFGRSLTSSVYRIGDHPIDQVDQFKDLGIVVDSPFSFNSHIHLVCAIANRRLGIIKKTFVSRDVKLLSTLYKHHVRPTLEYACVIWCAHTKKNIDSLEKIQKRFCSLFGNLHSLDYRHKLKALNLLSLSARRLRSKLIFLFKILTNRTCLSPSDFFQVSHYQSHRGNSYKLYAPFTKREYRSKFFTIDVISHWNALSDYEINVRSVSDFKHSICTYFLRKDIW